MVRHFALAILLSGAGRLALGVNASSLDADGRSLPSDWYLRIAGAITRMFHGELAPQAEMPSKLPAPTVLQSK